MPTPAPAEELRNQPEHQFAVLPRAIFAEFFHETEKFYGTGGMADATRQINERAFSPFRQRFNRGYFFTPFKDKAELGWSFMAGPCTAVGWAFTPFVTMTLLCIPAIGELVIGIVELIKALKCKVNGQPQEASLHFRNGLTRIALSPCLALISLLAIPLEVARFITRAFVSLIDLVKQCFTPSVNRDKSDGVSSPDTQGLSQQPVTAGAEPVGYVCSS